VKDGFVLLAGPVGDGRGKYELYHLNGDDGVPGANRNTSVPVHLGTVPTKRKGKAVGFTVIGESKKGYEILVFYDGVKKGGPRRFKVPKRRAL
jgi:hypothetical protein